MIHSPGKQHFKSQNKKRHTYNDVGRKHQRTRYKRGKAKEEKGKAVKGVRCGGGSTKFSEWSSSAGINPEGSTGLNLLTPLHCPALSCLFFSLLIKKRWEPQPGNGIWLVVCVCRSVCVFKLFSLQFVLFLPLIVFFAKLILFLKRHNSHLFPEEPEQILFKTFTLIEAANSNLNESAACHPDNTRMCLLTLAAYLDIQDFDFFFFLVIYCISAFF